MTPEKWNLLCWERVPRARRTRLPQAQGDLLGDLAAIQEKRKEKSPSEDASFVRPQFSGSQQEALQAGLEGPHPVLVLAGPEREKPARSPEEPCICWSREFLPGMSRL